jgi:hypothetical protein
MSPYRAAIERTTATIENRARYFRNLVIAVVVLCLATAVWAVVMRAPAALPGLLFLAPLAGSFFFADSGLLEQWRAELLAGWVRRDLDFAALRAALASTPTLPKQTVLAMLATLPDLGELASEQRISTPTRATVAEVSGAIQRRNRSLLGVRIVASAIAVSGVVASVLASSSIPLFGLIALGLLPVASVYIRRRYVLWRDTTVERSRDLSEFCHADCTRLIGTLEVF